MSLFAFGSLLKGTLLQPMDYSDYLNGADESPLLFFRETEVVLMV